MITMHSNATNTFLIFLCIKCIHIFGIETQTVTFMTDPSIIATTRKQYEHFFPSDEKNALIEHLKIKDPLYDAGLFQAYVALSDENVIPERKKSSYLLHKTFKYALDQLKNIVSVKKIYQKPLILDCWAKLYTQLKHFECNVDIIFTPHMAFNMFFQFAVLTDLARGRQFYYANKDDLNEHLEEYCIDIDDKMDNETIYNLHNFFNRLLSLFYDPADISSKQNLDFNLLRKYFDKADTVIIPITNKSGLIGYSTFVYALSKGFGLVGAGNELSTVHANNFSAICDLIFHDLLHILLWIATNKHSLTLENDLSLRSTFLEKTTTVLHTLVTEYKLEKNKENSKKRSLIKQNIYVLFFISHELAYPYKHYVKSCSTKQKIWLSDYVNHFFGIEKIKNLPNKARLSKEDVKNFLFNGMDQYFFLRIFDPRIEQWIHNSTLTINENAQLTKKNPNELITKQDLIFFFTIIVDRTKAVMAKFLNDYDDAFEGALPLID